MPSRIIQDIQKGLGTADNRPSKPDLPAGIQIPESENSPIEGENNEGNQIEYGMAAAISKAEAIDPQSLEEAMRRPDWPKWQIAIGVELEALKKAGT